MNLTINSLPTRTWNRLNMNESSLTVEGEFHNYNPKAVCDPAQVRWVPKAQWTGERVHLGSGEDFRALTEGADIGLAETAPGQRMDGHIFLTWHYGGQENSVSRIVLHAAESSTLNAVLLLESDPEYTGIAALRTEIYAEENSTVNVYVAQLLGFGGVGMTDISGICGDGATVNLTRLDLGAGRLYAGTHLDLRGRESAFNTKIGYHVRADQLLDMNYVALHQGKHSNSLMEINGTLEEHGKKVFRGSIDFQKGCAGAKGAENENVLLMGEELVNQTIPLILCKEENVEGSHGASIGQLDDKVLFYLSARGFTPEEAKQMIARSRIEDVCSRIPEAYVREQVHKFEGRRGELEYE